MKKYISKIWPNSSTAKLLFFLFLLLAVVIFASSSFYIEYLKDDKPGEAVAAEDTSAAKHTKNGAYEIPSDKNPSGEGEGSTTESSQAARQQEESLKTQINCKTTPVAYSTINQEVSWLPLGETAVIKGVEGQRDTCTKKIIKQPVSQIIYKGTKPLLKLLSVLGNSVEKLRATKISSCVESAKNLLPGTTSYEECYKIF